MLLLQLFPPLPHRKIKEVATSHTQRYKDSVAKMSSSPAAFRTTSAKTPTKQQRTPLGQLDVNTNKSMTSHHEECERRLQSAQAEYAKNLQQMRQDFINSELEIEQWQQSYADIQEQGKQLHAAYEIKCIKVKELGGQLEEAKVTVHHPCLLPLSSPADTSQGRACSAERQRRPDEGRDAARAAILL